MTFKRECKHCGEMFSPVGKHSHVCLTCKGKKYELDRKDELDKQNLKAWRQQQKDFEKQKIKEWREYCEETKKNMQKV